MWNVGLDEAQVGIKIDGEKKKKIDGDISIISGMQMTTPLWQKLKKN